MKIVIRAGGLGSRLWPISRCDNPKQFQNLVSDQSMIKDTFDRLTKTFSASDIFVSTNSAWLDQLRAQLPQLSEPNIITETDTRNTGPAMCLEVAYLSKVCAPDEIIATLPADDYLSDDFKFGELLKFCSAWLTDHPDYIVTPAVKTNCPDTGYSYMKKGERLATQDNLTIAAASDWVEKPDEARCQELLKLPDYFCHTGMYLWQLKNIAALFTSKQPKMWQICQQIAELMQTRTDSEQIKNLYNQTEKMTIETAITNQAPKIALGLAKDLFWSDLGKWHIIKKILSMAGDNLIKGDTITQNANNNLIYNLNQKKIIVINDLNDLVVVDTADALYISSLKNSAEVKKIVEKLKEENKQQYL